MGSIWSETVTLPSRSALEGEHSTEVAVVGGGMAGVLTAWFLRQRGAKVLLLEADRLAGGQTRNTTAKITAQHGMIYERLSEQKGELAARQYASANQRAVEAYRRLGIRALWLNRKGKPVPPGVEAAENLAEAARTLAPLF